DTAALPAYIRHLRLFSHRPRRLSADRENQNQPPTTASTTRQVSLQFSQRGFLPRGLMIQCQVRKYSWRKTRSGQRGGGDPPMACDERRAVRRRRHSHKPWKKVGSGKKWEREDEDRAQS